MASKPIILVLGASGFVGIATLKALVSKYGARFDIRAGVRDPSKDEKFQDLKDSITLVQATMGDERLPTVLGGVSRLFIVTPGAENRAELTISTAQSAKLANVDHIVVVSVVTAGLTSTIFGRQFDEIETHIKKLGVRYTFLRLPYFVDNYWAHKETIVEQGKVFNALDVTRPYTPVLVSDAGKAAATVLADPGRHVGKTYNVVSNRHTMHELCDELTTLLNKEVKYVQVSYQDAKKAFLAMGLPAWQVDGIMELYHLINRGSHVTNQASLEDYKKITGEAPTSLRDWLSSVIDAFQ